MRGSTITIGVRNRMANIFIRTAIFSLRYDTLDSGWAFR